MKSLTKNYNTKTARYCIPKTEIYKKELNHTASNIHNTSFLEVYLLLQCQKQLR